MQRLSSDRELTDGRERAPAADARDFALEDFLPYRLSVAANRISRVFARRYSEAFGISIAEWRVMAVLGRFGTLSPGGIAERTEMDKVKVSRAAARLASAGLLSSEPDAADGRVRRFGLTPRGVRLHAAIVPIALAMEAELAAGMPAADWEALRRLLGAVAEHARELEAKHEGPPDMRGL
jgi:DNA-binding MarR family transcriptional regulator